MPPHHIQQEAAEAALRQEEQQAARQAAAAHAAHASPAAAAANADAATAAADAADADADDGQPSELERQLVAWYRNTFLVTGAALAGSVWQWNFGARGKRAAEVFVPPRAAALPREVVEGWERSVRFKEGVRTVGRQTAFATGVAALYFGVELAALRARGGADDFCNTALAGAAAGGYLGSLLPGPSRARGAALGAGAGGALGALSGWAQQVAAAWAPEAAARQQQQQQQQQQGAASGSSGGPEQQQQQRQRPSG